MDTTYVVKRGDTLSEIAVRYNTTVAKLVELNDITNPDYIVVGQVLKLTGSASSPTPSKTSKAVIKAFGLQSNTDRTVYATWNWSKSNTENYSVVWSYATGDGVWFIGNESTVTSKQSLYTAPQNATKVKFKVKPISKKRTVNKKETTYWTASWSSEKSYSFSDNPPTTPPVPTLEINNYTLIASLTNLNVNATNIQFQVVKNDLSVFNTGTAKIKTSAASYSCKIEAGFDYKVRCRSYRGDEYSDWTDYTANVSAMPSTPDKITECKASSETSVYLAWTAVKNIASYEIEYATKKRYFDGSNETTTLNGITTNHYEITGLETGEEYFFRVRSVKSNNKASSWSEIKSVILGKTPGPPTTWSSTTTAIAGDPVNLYWVHNSEDGSNQSYAELELYIDGVKDSVAIKNTDESEDGEVKTSTYVIDTSEYVEGTKIQWRVRTAGITNTFGEWSTQRTIDVYAPATLVMSVIDTEDNDISELTALPFYIHGLAGPTTQTPISYHVIITANESYETVDDIGNVQLISAGDEIYSKHFDTNEPLMVEMSAHNINLENNISYTVKCIVSMNSGLTAESYSDFVVSWADEMYEPNAEISIDTETYTASVRPYCEDEDGNLIENVLISLYRREFDGTFTELAVDLDNTSNTYVTDPHPALNYARYRVVAKSEVTGAISYYDVPGFPVGGKAIIIQWDEKWSSFNTINADALAEPNWSGSLLKLPFNIDISDRGRSDVQFAEYAGREHPVTYYGTQKGETATWSVVIDKKDEETLYALRRLKRWMGDVYVREPSGSGYWASIVVSFSQKHLDVTIPVTLEITRVEGGA